MSQTETCFNKKISLCIPMYNESSIIADTAKTLHEYMSKTFADYEIIFSNDGSKDGCDRIAEEMNLPNVRVVGYPDNRTHRSPGRRGRYRYVHRCRSGLRYRRHQAGLR